MTTFKLDASGTVMMTTCSPSNLPTARRSPVHWADLSPFTQGYVEALFHDFTNALEVGHSYKQPAFSDLAPETLARIMEDCEACENEVMAAYPEDRRRKAGAWFWSERQAGKMGAFPPLTPYLGDDGKVYLRECA